MLPFRPVKEKKQNIYENIVLQIKAVILDGRLKPGDRLPSEREMANIFGVSRSCLREACKTLSTIGLVRVVHGRGIFVAKQESDEGLKQVISQVFSCDGQILRDLFEFRKLIEPQAAAWAAARRTEEEAENLWKLMYSIQETASPNLMQIWDHDAKFHTSIACATHNSVMVRTVHGILDYMAESRKNALINKERPPRSIEEHLAVARSIIQGNAAAAFQAMRHHLDNVEADTAHL